MKIYVAGTFTDQKALREQAAALWDLGHEITGTWLQEVKKPVDMSEDTFKKKLAIKDLCEVARADLVILDNRQSSGGKNVEWGFALGEFQTKQLWLVGTPTNVFQHLADETFGCWEELLDYLNYKVRDTTNDMEGICGSVGQDKGGDTGNAGFETAGGSQLYAPSGNEGLARGCGECSGRFGYSIGHHGPCPFTTPLTHP